MQLRVVVSLAIIMRDRFAFRAPYLQRLLSSQQHTDGMWRFLWGRGSAAAAFGLFGSLGLAVQIETFRRSARAAERLAAGCKAVLRAVVVPPPADAARHRLRSDDRGNLCNAVAPSSISELDRLLRV